MDIICLVEGCDYESPYKRAVQEHVADVHPKCAVCGRRLLDQELLEEHAAAEHPKAPEPKEPPQREIKGDAWKTLVREYASELAGLVAAVPDEELFERLELLLWSEGAPDPAYRMEQRYRPLYLHKLIEETFKRGWMLDPLERLLDRIERLLGWSESDV